MGDVTRQIAIAGGGTAGHVMAGLAFLKAYRDHGTRGFFLGCAHGIESRLVPARGETLTVIAGSPFAREGPLRKIAAISNAARGIFEARRILQREHVRLVIGVGGYASVGPVLAARSLGIPVVIHESNAAPGRANRFLGRFAARIAGGFEETSAAFAGLPVVYVGNPVTPGIHARSAPAGPRVRFLVTGGSEGSPFLNRETPALFAAMRRQGVDLWVRHLAGGGDVKTIRQSYARAAVPACVSSFVDNMAEIYDQSDLVIACPGAMTLAEIAAAGLPSLLVPLSGAAEQHQHLNARAFSTHTGSAWVTEEDWDTTREAARLTDLARDPAACARLGARAQTWGRPAAAQKLVRLCEELLRP